MKDKINFDMEVAIQTLRKSKDLSGKDDIFTTLIRQLTGQPCRPSWRRTWRQSPLLTARMAAPAKPPNDRPVNLR